MEFLQSYKQGIRIFLHVQPKASKTQIIGIHGDALKIAVRAAPVEGEANTAVCEHLAKVFRRAKRDVEILSGATGRKKSAYIDGLSLEEAKNILAPLVTKT